MRMDTVGRIGAEFLAMPGMRLTLEQAQRLRGVEREECRFVLEVLVSSGFLCRKSNGAYARSGDGSEHAMSSTIPGDRGSSDVGLFKPRAVALVGFFFVTVAIRRLL